MNEEIRKHSSLFFQYAHGVAIVFDLSRPETFEGALSWLSDVTEKLFDEKRELAAAEAAQGSSRGRSEQEGKPIPEQAAEAGGRRGARRAGGERRARRRAAVRATAHNCT